MSDGPADPVLRSVLHRRGQMGRLQPRVTGTRGDRRTPPPRSGGAVPRRGNPQASPRRSRHGPTGGATLSSRRSIIWRQRVISRSVLVFAGSLLLCGAIAESIPLRSVVVDQLLLR